MHIRGKYAQPGNKDNSQAAQRARRIIHHIFNTDSKYRKVPDDIFIAFHHWDWHYLIRDKGNKGTNSIPHQISSKMDSKYGHTIWDEVEIDKNAYLNQI